MHLRAFALALVWPTAYDGINKILLYLIAFDVHIRLQTYRDVAYSLKVSVVIFYYTLFSRVLS